MGGVGGGGWGGAGGARERGGSWRTSVDERIAAGSAAAKVHGQMIHGIGLGGGCMASVTIRATPAIEVAHARSVKITSRRFHSHASPTTPHKPVASESRSQKSPMNGRRHIPPRMIRAIDASCSSRTERLSRCFVTMGAVAMVGVVGAGGSASGSNQQPAKVAEIPRPRCMRAYAARAY